MAQNSNTNNNTEVPFTVISTTSPGLSMSSALGLAERNKAIHTLVYFSLVAL